MYPRRGNFWVERWLRGRFHHFGELETTEKTKMSGFIENTVYKRPQNDRPSGSSEAGFHLVTLWLHDSHVEETNVEGLGTKRFSTVEESEI